METNKIGANEFHEIEEPAAVDNLAIWKQVDETDMDFAKKFDKGRFSGTSINNVYMVKQATSVFGPMGIGWGIDIVKEDFLEGHPFFVGEEKCHTIIHCLKIKLWYTQGGERGEITHFGQTPFITNGKNGPYTDEEAPKKSLTDATSKALSMLGFSADVYMGEFDDQTYVNELAAKQKIEKADDKDKALIEEAKELDKWFVSCCKTMCGATSKHDLDTCYKQIVRKFKRREVVRPNEKERSERYIKQVGLLKAAIDKAMSQVADGTEYEKINYDDWAKSSQREEAK